MRKHRRPPNPTQEDFMPQDMHGNSTGPYPRVHMGNRGLGLAECDRTRRLDMKREVCDMQWRDVTCPKCQAMLRVKQPAGPRNWKRFVAQCSMRGEGYLQAMFKAALPNVQVSPLIPHRGTVGNLPLDIEPEPISLQIEAGH